LGILGGTFDPVHNAHLAVARAALEHLELDSLIWIPTGRPNYREPAVASPAHRVAMLRLAIAGEPRYAIDERELAERASGYTVDTLEELKNEHDTLYLILGADQYAALDSWHRPDDVKRLARIAVVGRPGYAFKGKGVHVVPMPPLDVSSSEVRARAGRGEDLGALVPPAVANYIRREGLYS
jgi:nicotinate-nucleotide adenylyltransferase